MKKSILCLFFCCSVVFVISTNAFARPGKRSKALNICRTSNGAIKAKAKCNSRKGEFALNLGNIVGVQGTAGQQGAKGDMGAQGPQGPQGPRGVSSFDQLPPGQTILGRVRVFESVPAGSARIISRTADFPARAFSIINSDQIIVKINTDLMNACPNLSTCLSGDTANALAKSNLCTGTFEIPTAPPGFVCIYPSSFINVNKLFREGLSATQFFVAWIINGSVNSGISILDFSWSYTEPNIAAARLEGFEAPLENKMETNLQIFDELLK